MTLDQIFGSENKNFVHLDKKLRNSIAYTLDHFRKETNQQELRSFAIRRNNEWKQEYHDFISTTSPKTEDGRLNNAFYRKKQKYDVLVPYSIYSAIMDYYFYSIENDVREDVDFMDANLDSIMTFCQMVDYYNQRYMSFHHCRRSKTPLAVKLIYSFIGREYTKTVSFLEKIGVLDVDKMFIPAKWDVRGNREKKGLCRHYQFTMEKSKEYCVHQVTSRRIISRLQSTITKFDELEYVNDNSNTVKDKELNNYFSKHFTLADAAFDDRAKDYEGYNRYMSKVSAGENRLENFTIGRDKFGTRLYHPFLNMKKELRAHITIDGSADTATIDLNNSHPYFFSLLFDSTFVASVKHILFEEEVELFESIASNPEFQEQVSLFKKIAASGNYYNFLADNIKSERSIKEINMYYFYGRLNKRNMIYRFFEGNFNFVNIVKKNIIRMSGYKRLCQILQRVEAHFMIDKVFTRLMASGYSVMPLHDAIMCKHADAETVKKAICTAFEEIGIEPPVFDKQATFNEIQRTVDSVRRKNFNHFLNKNVVLEGLNEIIKHVGINNRVFKEGMKPENVAYIDGRFEERRHLIDDGVAEKYYELRFVFDCGHFDKFDFTELYSRFRESDLAKKKFYTRDVVAYVKVNPVEFLNHALGTTYKTRVKENGYIY